MLIITNMTVGVSIQQGKDAKARRAMLLNLVSKLSKTGRAIKKRKATGKKKKKKKKTGMSKKKRKG
jgi:hypothetical protein